MFWPVLVVRSEQQELNSKLMKGLTDSDKLLMKPIYLQATYKIDSRWGTGERDSRNLVWVW